jgi:uncharacterized protein YbcI
VEESAHPATAAAAISQEIVQLLKELLGRGPTMSRTHLLDDCVLVLMREGHTTTEATMATAGRQRDVAQQRVDLSDAIRQRFVDVVERHVGRRVVGFMTGSQQEPDLLCQVFVLEKAPLLREDLD